MKNPFNISKRQEKQIIEETRKELHKIKEQQKVGYKTPELFLKEAQCYTSLKHPDRALEIYKAISTNPSFPDDVRAEAYARVGMIENDVEKLSKAIDLDEKAEYLHNRAYRLLGAYHWTGDESFIPRIEEDLTRCIEMQPDFYGHYELRAKERAKAGDEEGAGEDIISIFEKIDDKDFLGYYYDKGRWRRLMKAIKSKKIRKRTSEMVGNILKEKKNN